MKIKFTDIMGISKEYFVSPAIKNIPQWYIDNPLYTSGKKEVQNGHNSHTIRKCMPVFDAMTAGYIIFTYVDIFISQQNGVPIFHWPKFNPIEFHNKNQLTHYPIDGEYPPPKFMNPWSISTPKGYSCLFISPMHNPNNFFSILPGIVDTDKYNLPVNFPFILKDYNMEGVIPAGTPMAQVIPFKRDSFEMKTSSQFKNKFRKQETQLKSLWFNAYKKNFWNKKEYM